MKHEFQGSVFLLPWQSLDGNLRLIREKRDDIGNSQNNHEKTLEL
jgi:hypothetical protein